MPPLHIEWIEYGCAYRLDHTILVNKAFRKAPGNVYAELMQHEHQHQPGAYVWDDLWHDIRPRSLAFYLFCLQTPSTWWAFLPVMKIKGRWEIDYGSLPTYLLFLILLAILLTGKNF